MGERGLAYIKHALFLRAFRMGSPDGFWGTGLGVEVDILTFDGDGITGFQTKVSKQIA